MKSTLSKSIQFSYCLYLLLASSCQEKFVVPDPIDSINEAYVTLYDDKNFKDRKFTIKYDNNPTDFDKVKSDDGKLGFGDKTSSIRWQIPKGYKCVLYDDSGYRDRYIELLPNNGVYQEIRDLDANDFGDKTSSVKWFRTSPPKITNVGDAYVDLFDDTYFKDRQLTLKYGNSPTNFDNISSDDGKKGFGDKASSVRWQIPKGYKCVLYDDNGYRDRKIELVGNGLLQEIKDLDTKNFGDKTSSAKWLRDSPPKIKDVRDAYVELFDDNNFSDRQLTLKYGNSPTNFDNISSDDGKKGFGDKTSSVRWQIPKGYKCVLYDDNGYRDRKIELVGNGLLQEIKDLNTKNFGDKTSSLKWFEISSNTISGHPEANLLKDINSAYVELYDDNNFGDRQLTIKYNRNISNLKNVKSDNGKKGFGDKTSAVRWKIPIGYKFVLYDDANYKDRKLILIGNGKLQEIRNLNSKNFNDKASSCRWERN